MDTKLILGSQGGPLKVASNAWCGISAKTFHPLKVYKEFTANFFLINNLE